MAMTIHLKQYSLLVLTAWLLSWAIVVYEPCCDSVLDKSGHYKDHQSQYVHADTQHDSTQSHQNSTHDCRVAIENLDDLTVPVSAFLNSAVEKTEHCPDAKLVYSKPHATYFVQSYLYHSIHPPPSKHPLYFSTLRFRV